MNAEWAGRLMGLEPAPRWLTFENLTATDGTFMGGGGIRSNHKEEGNGINRDTLWMDCSSTAQSVSFNGNQTNDFLIIYVEHMGTSPAVL